MSNPVHHRGPCGSVDHTYWSYMIVYCPHRQQYSLTAVQYLETGTAADPVNFKRRHLELGPFDTRRDAVELITAWLAEDQADEVD